MPPGHDIAGLGIGPRNVGENVVCVHRAIVELRIAIQFDDRRGPDLCEARKPSIIFRRQLEARQRRRVAGHVGIALAADEFAVTVAFAHPGQCAFLPQERVEVLRELHPLQSPVERVGVVLRQLVIILIGNVLVAQSLERRIFRLVAGTGKGDEDDLPCQLSVPRRKMLDLAHRSDDDRRTDRSVGTGGPGDGNFDHVDWSRLDHARAAGREVPPTAEVERLAVDVGQTVRTELVERPFLGLPKIVRVGQPRTDFIHELGRS